MPRRIQLSRAKGWRKPAGAVVVARPTRWGNPHPWPEIGKAEAKRRFQADLLAGRLPFTVADVRRALAGKDLCCWCKPGDACHADVLLEIANSADDVVPAAGRSGG